MRMRGWVLELVAVGALAAGTAAWGDVYVQEGELQSITEEEWAEVTAPTYGGGNWMTWLEHRGEADGWEGKVDLKGWFGRKKAAKPLPKGVATMGKVVYGWLPYWATSAQMDQFQWDKLTHVAYFSYEVNSANGECSGKHSWGSSIVQKAHNKGVKIHLTATLFGSSGNKALLQSETSCNTLVANLVSEVKSAGGDGICIDFESVGSWTGATKALTSFMTKLANAAKDKNLEVSIALPSIDWYTDFDVASFEKLGIMCIIMGYDYHYSGSSVPGPVAPLMPSSRWGTQLNDDYSVRYYLGKMTNAAHLYLAVPYYGRKWKASSTALGASSLGSSYSSSPVLSTCASSASSYGRKWDSSGSVPYYVYTDSAGAAWQCFYDDVESLGLKYDYINSKGLGGVGIWALSHEPGTAKFWNLLYEKFGPGTGGGGSSGGGGTVEDGSAMVTWNFSASEGWASQNSNFTGVTNVAGEAWSLNEARVYPSATYGSATGDLWLDVPGSYAVTPAIKGVVATQVVLVVRAAANSNLSGRKVGVYYSVNGGSSWTKAGTVSATAYNSLTPSSVSVPSQGGGSSGVMFKLLDESTTQETGTVLVYQMVVKGKDATTGTLKVTLTPSSAKWSLNGTTYASGDTITLAAGTYTVTFNALAGYDTPASQSVTIVAGGSKTVTAKYTESSNWTRTIEFASSDGWSAKTDAFFAGTTNVAGEAWSARGLKVNPTVNSQNNIGYATLDGTGDYLVTPAFSGTVTKVSGMIRAGANSNLDGRKLRVDYSLGGGSWQTLDTWSANNYSAAVTCSKSCSLSHASGVKFRFYDAGTTDTNKTTVVLHQIVLNGTKDVSAPQTGWIKATLDPSGATWKVAGTNHNSGTSVKLPVGTYTVSFNTKSGYIAPSDQSVTVTSGKTNSITATYTVMPGALTVNLTPEEAAASAKWKLSGQSATHASGETVSLSPGSYTVTFNALSGFNAPADQTVSIAANQGKEITGAYTEKPASLTVNLTPATATWKVSGSSANHASGETVSLAAGTYTVTFNALDGYDAPEPVEVTLTRGGSKTISKSYTGNGNWTKGYSFTTAEGWKERASVVSSLSTNVAGETWKMEGVKIFPTYATNNETGYIVIEQTGNWVELPTFAGTVTQVSAKVRAGWNTELEDRKLTLQYNLGQGWVDWVTWTCNSYTSVISRSKSGSFCGGSAGVRLRVIDTSVGDVSKSTVVLHAITVKGNSDAGAASTGTLTTTLTPDTATWTVGGQTYASGATATLVAGNYTVSFNAASGYDTPASSNVTVAAGASKTLKATYAAQPGTLTVTLNPADVRGTATWKAAGTNHSSGASATLKAGTYSVTFGAVDGYVTPSSQSVTVPPGGAATASATYEVKPASLKVTLDPPGGTWKVAGTNFESGATAKLAPGTYTVSFNPQTGYATPENQSVTLAAGQSKTMTVTYPGLEGSVRYVLSPAEAVAAGAKWKINGTTNASGDTVTVPSGTYTVTFSAATGYAAPASETVVVDAEETVQRTAEYTEKPGNLTVTIKMNPSNDTALAAARWYADGESHAGGERVALPPGTHTVTFSAVEGYTTPEALEVTIESSKSISRTVTYVGAPGNVTYTLTPNTGSWKINGETYASGAVAEVPAGNYTVSFGTLTGYTVPSNQAVTVTAGQTTQGTASYAIKQVPLTVKLTPTNATWNVEGGTYDSGTAVRLDPGEHTVTFNAVAGYETPAATNVTLNVGANSKTVNVKYAGLPGDVTYTLTPPEGTWKIAGTTNESDEVASVPAGEYTVTFGTLTGYTKPADQTIEVTPNGMFRGTAEYVVKQVPLTVKLAPTNDATLQASARWSVVGISGVHTNAEKLPLDPGTYTVTASDVPGWTTPAATDVTLNLNSSGKTITMTYKVAPGRVTFTLTPAEATWKINNKTYASGETAEVTAGTYEVTFNALEGYAAPAAQSVTVAAGEEVSRNASYTALPATLTVTLTPATASWTVNGSSYASGETATLAVGTYTVSFGAVSGYVTPANQSVTLARGEAKELNVEYVPEAVGVPVLQNATGVTTGAFDIAWSGVSGATKYVVQVAASPDFDEEVLLECDFTSALDTNWYSTATLVPDTGYAAGGAGHGAMQFKGNGKLLRTPVITNAAGRLFWYHSTASDVEWKYEVQCATDTNFTDAITVTNFTIAEKITNARLQSVDLGGLSDIYVRWLDTREGTGTAQRYISGVTLMTALAAEKTTTGTSASFTGLEPGKTYYVRAKAETSTGESEWSGVKTVQTAEAPATLTVTLTPAGGTWTVGGVMYANGATATLAAGTYRVTFNAADGYVSPAEQTVTLASGEVKVLTVPCEPEPVGVPVLGEGADITTGAFSIAWSGVTGATKYTVQVAESATFDDGVAVSASFEDGAMPVGWMTNKVTFSTAKTAFSGDGKGVAIFAGSNHWLRTPKLSRPGVMGWSHSKNTGSAAGTAWSYVVECSDTEDFADVTWTKTVEVNDSVTTPTAEVADLTGQRNVYVRWRDTRASGTAQRYLSEIVILDALTAENTTTGTSAAFSGLAASTVYYVRVKATTATGDSEWSGVKTVQTAEAPATLTVTLTPAGGTWTVGGVTYANGATATLAAGTYTVTFSAADGYLSPAAQTVTLVPGEAKVLEIPCEPEPVGVPVLGAGSGITTGAFSIAWSGVTGATKYTVQVAESATFDDGVAVSASFEDGAMPVGWMTNKVTFSTAKTAFSGDGKGVAIFAGSNHWLRTPKLSRPGVMGWSHAKNTGSAAGTAWSYVVECSATEDFADVTWTKTVEVNDSVTTPTAEVADLTGQRNVYVRWRDTRASGTAQRYLSEIVILDALTAENTTTGTTATFDGLAASTVYYVRVKATTATGDSDWSLPQTVTTADPPTAPAPPMLEDATEVTESGFTIGWSAPDGAEVYRVEVSDCETFDDEPILAYDFTGNLPEGWAATGATIEGSQFAPDNGNAWVFSSSNHYLRTAMVTNPASVTWYYATGSTNAWSYEVQASPTEDFAAYQVVYTSPTITEKVNPTKVVADLRPAVRNLGSRFYLRWDDTRPNGGAKRYISGISVSGALLVNETISGRTRTVTGLSSGTTYYVRVQAWGPGGWSDWSAVKSVTTSSASGEIDPDNPPYNPALELPSEPWEVRATLNADGSSVSLNWDAVPGARGYNVEACTDLREGAWTRVDTQMGSTNSAPSAVDGDGPVFYRVRVW